jgi:alkylation response protein AidB-like acyl-CoA dehydrogenase
MQQANSERQLEVGTPRRADPNSGLSLLLDEIDSLAPVIAAGAAAAEADRRISNDLQRRLRDAGLFRMALPVSHGGLELDLPSLMHVTQRLSRLDGSVGWVLGHIRGISPVVEALMSRERFDAFYCDGPNVAVSASAQLTGTIERVKSGWEVNGRWPFVSGCTDADWIAVRCVVIENGEPLSGPMPNTPAIRFALVPRAQTRIEDNWCAMGLKASDSHDVTIQNVIIPQDDAIDHSTASACVPGPLYGSPFQIIALNHAAIALGIAEGALDDVLSVARSGRRLFNATHAQKDSELFLSEIARVQADLQAAQAYSDASTERLWQELQAGTVPPGPPRPEILQAAVWITETCRRITRTCFELGGASAVYDRSPLQRRLRDMETAAQHAQVQRRNYGPIGAAILANGASSQPAAPATNGADQPSPSA